MKSCVKRIIFLSLVVVMVLSCFACVPKQYKKGVEVDKSFPEGIIPVYEDAIVFEFDNKDDGEFELNCGTKDKLKDVVDFYEDYFEDNDIIPDEVKDKKTKYKAEGYYYGFDYELTIKEPTAKYEKRKYSTVVEIELKGELEKEEASSSIEPIVFDVVDITDNQQTKDVLLKIDNDIVFLNELISDESEEELSFEETMRMIDEYLLKTQEKMVEVEQRTSKEKQINYLLDSELNHLSICYDLFLELKQVVEYAVAVESIFVDMDDIVSEGQQGDMVDMYEAIRLAFDNCITAMSGVEAPSFLQFRHNQLIENLKEFQYVASDSIYAVALGDNLLASNNMYFIDYYLSYIDRFSVDLDNDMNNRLAKYEDDIDYLDTWLMDIEDFIDDALETNMLDLSRLNEGYFTNQVEVSYNLEVLEEIIPANYRSLDHLVFLELWTNMDSTDVMVTVEIPEYTQKYQEKVTITRAETELAVLPPLVSDISEKLKTSKDAQINITVEDMNSGEIIVQKTQSVKMFSIYDMRWASDEGLPYLENSLAWVTPENDMILTLLRNAADSLNMLSGGEMNSIVGYQGAAEDDLEAQANITYAQTAAIMHAMADTMQVKYINAAFSSTDTNLQRVATPQRVLENKSGLCIETAVTLASAIKSAGMNAMVLFLPGHAQVAVETWYGSGEYFLVETTALDSFRNENFDFIEYYDQEGWADYIYNNGVTAIDCNMAKLLDIHPID